MNYESLKPAALAAPAEDRIGPIVKRLALVFALLVAIGLPGGYFGLQYSNHVEHVEMTARLKAESLDALVASNPELWVYQLQRVEELLLRYPPQLADDRAIVRDAAGNILVALGVRPHAPLMIRSSPIYDSGRVVGQVEIEHSYRDVVSGTLVAGLLGLLLGVLVYATVLVLPLRALRRVTAALIHETAALDAIASRYQAVAETTNDAIITADGGGAIVGWNPAAERMFGYTEAEAIGQALTLVIPHRYHDGHLNGIRRIQAGGARHVVGKSVELHGVTKAGREFPLELALSEWETREGRLFAGIIRDITERKHAELVLARQKDLYDMLSQTNQAIVRITSRDELFHVVCRVAVEHGRFRFAWVGLIDEKDQRMKPVARYGEDAGYLDQMYVMADESETAGRGPAGQGLRAGEHVVIDDFLNDPATAPWHEAAQRAGVRGLAALPIRQGGAVVGAINVCAGEPGFFTREVLATLDEMAIDVSYALGQFLHAAERIRTQNELRQLNETLEQRVAERTNALQAANRELEAFSYSVSHDLRAPLRAIDGFSSLIEKNNAEQLDERGKDYISRVRAGAARMADLIDDLLKLSRISRQEMQLGLVDLSGLAHEVVEELKDEESERKAEWIIAPQVATQGDRGLLKVVLKNLIGNALKYSSGREAVRIEFGVTEKEGRPVYFVRDNGVGFDMAYADKLFGAFQRLHSPAEFPGTGIGLATVSRIISRHGGRVWAEGRVGVGATFYFTLRDTIGT